MTMLTLKPDEAQRLVRDALVRSRTREDNAEAVARALVGAELCGQAGHGLRRVKAYAAQAARGKVDGHARPSARVMRRGALAVDAAHGFAYPAIDLAADWLPGAARENGIAMAGIARSHHAGVAGLAVEALAEKGLVALMFANAPASIAPFGARRPLFGTDPIAFAAPVPGNAPVVVDISLSRAARGKVMAAAQKGEPIPEGWALDPDGNPTTDAEAGLAGTMVPVGEAKGTALALMVELLAAGLTGSHFAYESTSLFDDKGHPPGLGQLVIAIDPEAFGADAPARFAAMAATMGETEGARLPGRRRQALRERLAAEGFPVEADLVAEIRAIGR